MVQQSEARSWKITGLVGGALMIMGVLQVYNIVGHRQNLIDLSESVKVIAAWWRYYLSIPFAWVEWDLTPLQREVFTLIAFFGSAANFAHLRRRGGGIVGFLRRNSDAASQEHGDQGAEPNPDIKAAIQFFLIAALLYVFYRQWYLILIIAAAGLAGVFVVYYAYINRDSTGLGIGIFGIMLLIPILTLSAWVEGIAHHYRSVFRSLRFLLLLLVADLAARYVLDPLIQTLPRFSYPPPIPG